MTGFYTAVLVFHVLVAALIIGLVLLQRGKGAETGAAFGGGASGTVFGARGSANFLSRTTAVLATLFFVTSMGLAYMSGQRPAPDSILDRTPGSQVILPGENGDPDVEDLPTIRDPGVAEPGDSEPGDGGVRD